MGSAASPLTFSLSSLMLFMVFISVGLGLTITAPGLGIPLVVLGIASFARTAGWAIARRAEGTPLTAGEKVGDFLAGIALIAAVLLAGAVATFVTCLPFCGLASSGSGQGFLGFSIVFGLLTAGVVGIWTMLKLGQLWLGREPRSAKPVAEAVRCKWCGARIRQGALCWMCGMANEAAGGKKP